METIDSLKTDNKVAVTIYGPENDTLFQSTGTGYHSLETAVIDNIKKANLKINPEDCVFEVTNIDKGVTHRYRLNAHGHLKLII